MGSLLIVIDPPTTTMSTSLHDSLVFPSNVTNFISKLEYAYSKSGKDLKALQREVEEKRSKLKRSLLYGEDQSCKVGDRISRITKLFDAWAHMAKLFNVRYVLIYGSLIGAERDRKYCLFVCLAVFCSHWQSYLNTYLISF